MGWAEVVADGFQLRQSWEDFLLPPMSVAAHDFSSGWESRSNSEFRRQRCKVVLKIHFIGFLAQVCVCVRCIYREFG